MQEENQNNENHTSRGFVGQPVSLGAKSNPARIPLGQVAVISNCNYNTLDVIAKPPRLSWLGRAEWSSTRTSPASLASRRTRVIWAAIRGAPRWKTAFPRRALAPSSSARQVAPRLSHHQRGRRGPHRHYHHPRRREPEGLQGEPPNNPDIGPGESRVFKVNFKPKAIGNRGATLHVKTNGSAEKPFDIKLAGFGAGIR